jgi:hypothetical protein
MLTFFANSKDLSLGLKHRRLKPGIHALGVPPLVNNQSGAALVEMLAGISMVGAITATALNYQQQSEAQALRVHAQMTASALISAVSLHQAKWAVRQVNGLSARMETGGQLAFTQQGIPSGVDNEPAASQQDCDALWHELVVSIAYLDDNSYWKIEPDGWRCRFSYHHNQLPSLAIYYHTLSGEVTFR